MAITITKTKEPSGFYPAYNDSYIQFTSSLTGVFKAVMTITGLTDTFTIYPDANGVFLFNLKHAVKALMDTDGFKDNDDSFPASWLEAYPFGFITVATSIQDFGDTDGDADAKNYTFIRGVKQVGESIYANQYQLLAPSVNGVDYDLTYFEGFPFSFEVLRVLTGEDMVVRNLNSGDAIVAVSAVSDDTQRIWIDKASDNWTLSSYLPLMDSINRLSLEIDTVAVTNIDVLKVPSRCGIYLKWYNNDGGYSYHLFDEHWKELIKHKHIGRVSSNSFENVGSTVAPTESKGKIATKIYTVKTTVNENQALVLESLYSSPSVQVWSKVSPFQVGEFIDVEVVGNYQRSTKKDLNTLTVNVVLPELITAQL